MPYIWQGGSRKTEGGRLAMRAWLVCFVLASLLLLWPRGAGHQRWTIPPNPGTFRAAPEVVRSIPRIKSQISAARENVPEGVRRLNLSRAVLSRDCSILFLPNLYGITATGKILWSFTGSHNPRGSLFDPLIEPDGTVYVGFNNHPHAGYVYAPGGRTGKVKWERDLQS